MTRRSRTPHPRKPRAPRHQGGSITGISGADTTPHRAHGWRQPHATRHARGHARTHQTHNPKQTARDRASLKRTYDILHGNVMEGHTAGGRKARHDTTLAERLTKLHTTRRHQTTAHRHTAFTHTAHSGPRGPRLGARRRTHPGNNTPQPFRETMTFAGVNSTAPHVEKPPAPHLAPMKMFHL